MLFATIARTAIGRAISPFDVLDEILAGAAQFNIETPTATGAVDVANRRATLEGLKGPENKKERKELEHQWACTDCRRYRSEAKCDWGTPKCKPCADRVCSYKAPKETKAKGPEGDGNGAAGGGAAGDNAPGVNNNFRF